MFGFVDSESAKNYNTIKDLTVQNSLGNHFREVSAGGVDFKLFFEMAMSHT